MAVIRLEFEIDSEVYPELHATLRAIKRPEARAERLRQLAASGLVWERVRIGGPAMLPPGPAPAPVPAAQVPVLQDVVDIGSWPGTPAPDEPPAPPPLEAGVRRTGARSARLKRMNDRGLFKNG